VTTRAQLRVLRRQDVVDKLFEAVVEPGLLLAPRELLAFEAGDLDHRRRS